MRAAVAFWDFRASFYDQARKVFPLNLIFKREFKNLGLLLSKIDKKDANVLDVASGTGAIISLLPAYWKIFRTDSSMAMLQKSERSFRSVAADCRQLPFKPATFDIITAVGLVEYLRNPLIFFKQLQSITTDGAKIVFTYAQYNLLNIARNFLGQRIFIHDPENLEQIYIKTGFKKEAQIASLIQTQVLLTKT